VWGGVAGGQIGANYQIGGVVLGIEADGQWNGQTVTNSGPILTPFGIINGTETDSVPWFATVRGRLGYAFLPGWLVYGTAGGAWVEVKSTATLTGPVASIGFTLDQSHAAWVAGVGTEWAFAPNWSVKAEYLFIDTGTFNATVNVGVLGPVTGTLKLQDSIARFGMNYRF
jgi:outer membrane immunogenic protein